MAASRSVNEAAFVNPRTSSGGLHEAGRFRRGIAEFLRRPLLITAGFALLAVGVSLLDALTGHDAPLRKIAADIVPGNGALNFIAAVATSLLTVTSITFSVLLLAVQQTANSLTSVVFDQFLRRSANQVYFGFFVGVSTFSFIVLGTARAGDPPAYGAALTLILTVVALVVLLLLIHGSIDQMRPESVVRSIHELALRARERELVLLGKTRAERRSPEDSPCRDVHVIDSGYVVSIAEHKLADVARGIGPDAEIIVEGLVGEYLIFDDIIARIVGIAPDDDSFDEQVLLAFGLDDIRDVDVESGYAIDQLENIAWSTGASAGQSPNTAKTAIRAIRDLVTRWLMAGERDRADVAQAQDELPIVYEDGAAERGADALATLLVATSESRQAQSCAELVRAFAGIIPHVRTDRDRHVLSRALDSALPSVIQHAEIPPLHDALAQLEEVLGAYGFRTERVTETRQLLRLAPEQMSPKPSDQPESVRPR
jgi:uncharacterized membrane protein